MSGNLEIFFVRHGQSTANAAGVWQGRLEYPLSDLGREQARRAGLALAGAGDFCGVYTSPLSRARETAGIIGAELASAGRFGGEVAGLPGLTERHGGILQGRPFEESRRENPRLLEKFRRLPEEEAWTLVGAETDGALMDRFGSAIADIRERRGDGDQRVVVVAHGGVLRAFLRGTFGGEVLPGAARTPNASITSVSWKTDAGRPELETLASTSHLEDLEV